MGMWQTGYREHHEEFEFGPFELPPIKPVQVRCETCNARFNSRRELYDHRFSHHPTNSPSISIRGKTLDGRPLLVSKEIQPEDIDVRNVTACRINGSPISILNVQDVLSRFRNKTIDIEIENDGVVRSHQLNYLVAEPSEIRIVEEIYRQIAIDGPLSIQAINTFIDKTRKLSSARMYQHGISQYLYGVLAKDGARDSNLAPGDYIFKFNEADETLSSFDTLPAITIRSAIAFHRNRFDDAIDLTTRTKIGFAADIFRGILLGELTAQRTHSDDVKDAASSFFFIDHDTDVIADYAANLTADADSLRPLVKAHLGKCRNSMDRLKLALLFVESHKSSRDDSDRRIANGLCQEYLHDHDIGGWATLNLRK